MHELEIHAWHKKLVKLIPYVKARLEADPLWFHPVIAGRWVWGLSAWIGSGWCHVESKQMPHLGGSGLDQGCGVHNGENRTHLYEVFRALSERLRHVRVTCGDFERILSPVITWKHGTTGVFLDPPYPPDAGSSKAVYGRSDEREVFDRAFRYCVENGHDKRLRIAFCYYDGTPVDGQDVSTKLRTLRWDVVPWKARGGYGGQSGTNENAARERIAFSPGCIREKQRSLFE